MIRIPTAGSVISGFFRPACLWFSLRFPLRSLRLCVELVFSLASGVARSGSGALA